MIITSIDNPKIKRISKIRDSKKSRRELREFLLEGLRIVSDAIAAGCARGVFVRLSDADRLKQIPAIATHNELYVVADKVFDTISDTINSQGVIALCDIASKGKRSIGDKVLVLDRIRDPGNLGTILRTAAAADYMTVYCINCTDPYNPKSVRSSMGGVLYLDIIESDCNIIQEIRTGGYTVVAADTDGKNIFDDGLVLGSKICLVLGSESNGIDEVILDKAEHIVSIPMRRGESLNVAVSAGILMYCLGGSKRPLSSNL